MAREGIAEKYRLHMALCYNDVELRLDRMVLFWAGVIGCEMLRKSRENHFCDVIKVIEESGWSSVSRCLESRYGHTGPMDFLHKSDLWARNISDLKQALMVAWNQSPVLEASHRQWFRAA